jgi:hypothetical protein
MRPPVFGKESQKVAHSGEPGVVGQTFDDLARRLAEGTISRRRALRLFGAALVGVTTASIPGVAWAVNGGNSACAHFCNQAFPPGPQRGKCKSEGAHGEGPCYECTPGVGPGPHFTPRCRPNEKFNPKTCKCEAVACRGNPLPGGACNNQATCGEEDQNCGCLPTTEASFFCIEHGGCGEPCTSTRDCPKGQGCVFSCCGGPDAETKAFCQFPCGVGAAGASAVEGGRTTFGG